MKDCARDIVLLKLTTDGHKASRGLSATVELCVVQCASLDKILYLAILFCFPVKTVVGRRWPQSSLYLLEIVVPPSTHDSTGKEDKVNSCPVGGNCTTYCMALKPCNIYVVSCAYNHVLASL